MPIRRSTATILYGVIASFIIASPASAQMSLPKAAPRSPEKEFGQQCGACHSTRAGETRVGPSLWRVAGRKAGSLPGYSYSTALKKSGIVWNNATLDKWLTSSVKTVPGTTMAFTQADADKRRAIIRYMTGLK